MHGQTNIKFIVNVFAINLKTVAKIGHAVGDSLTVCDAELCNVSYLAGYHVQKFCNANLSLVFNCFADTM